MEVDITKLKAYQTMPALKSPDTDWIKWADYVIGKYGVTLGKQVFMNTWQKRGSRDANTRPLRVHLKDKYNVEIEESVWDKIVDVGGGIGDTFGKIFKVGKWTIIIGGGIVLVLAGLTVYTKIKAAKGALK